MKRIAYALAAFWIVLTLLWLSVAIAGGASVDELVDEFGMGIVVVGISYPAMGALIASRHPRNAVAWIYLAIGSVTASGPILDYARWALIENPGSLPGGVFASWLGTWIWFPGLGILLAFSLLFFPDGRLPSGRWKVVAWSAAAGIVLTATEFAAKAWLVRGRWGLEMSSAEFDAMASPLPLWLSVAAGVLLAVGAVGGVASLFFRYRSSSPTVRIQLTWVMFAGAVTVVSFPLIVMNPELRIPQLFVFPLVPIATAVAILRYRLYDIDVVVNRTLVYGALTAILGGAYLGLVTLLQAAFRPITPDSDLAVVASTLAVAALFRPVRSSIQAFIDRRFYRSRYDAARTLEAFGARLRDEVELASLRAELLSVVADTVQPSHARLWLREEATG